MNSFKNKVILVLGGSGSIGSAVSAAFEEEGAIVCRHGFRRGEYRADLRRAEEVEQLVWKAASRFGKVDILVNAVSTPVSIAPFVKKTWDDFEAHLDLQLKSAVLSAREVVPMMKEQGGGKIIHVLTTYVGGETPPSIADYMTAKYALWGFTKALAKEVGKWKITVNAVSPGYVDNEFNAGTPGKLKELIIHETPLRRLATTEDVAGAVLYLASGDADFVTGENIQIAGGAHL